MMSLNLLPVFVVGLAGSVHCIGMCGGIVGALSAGAPRRTIPIVPANGTAVLALADSGVARVLAYNAGRIGSYMVAGALAAGLVNGAASLARIAAWQGFAYLLANFMLIALGLYLMDAWRGLAHVEQAGKMLWRRVQPLMRPLLPMDTLPKAFALGGLWGWVPCGMVYSVLLTALLSGSAAGGAAVMLVFGLGTLPMLLALGLAGTRLRAMLQQRRVRLACGLLVLAFGLLGIARYAGGLQHGWLDALCVGAA
ncbi:sulfite exporter TauE/SafE family protein [Massilia sp. YMA4]|uniref:sulfite exporter TauE/SafE family protein n=1 Tax=Massilia sp. YMA4 TaxID=1593482 RepID=UPI000DD18688|nr:sulfite exporter TauE/SafE family protein [Massilia sp. YMA4]AXA94814.1 sulfite exporter TauE/SafE family protein [Massilia sp. YMA4]